MSHTLTHGRILSAVRGGLRIGLIAAASLALAAPATGAEKLVEIRSDGPGPERFDHVEVHQFGPKRADTVLVLMPGTVAGAGDFTAIVRQLVDRVGRLQVWAVDRRSQPLEDTSVFERLERGEVSLQEAFDYYLGWLDGGGPEDHFDPLDVSTVPFAREWGMEVALKDARKVVLAARKGGRSVLLGGHSLGASLTAAYAAWDFEGGAGFRDVDGLVLIDGGLLGSFDGIETVEEAEQEIAELEEGNPFLDLIGAGLPEATGLFAEVGGYFARLDPMGSARMLQDFPLLPDAFDPGITVTNRGLLGYSFDRDTSPQDLRLLHVNGGGLDDTGDPRDWVDGGITRVQSLAETFGQEPSNGVEWYFPRRLTIDTDGANEMRMNDVARFLGLRLRHTRKIDTPIYAFGTELTGGAVERGARRLVKRVRTTKRESLIVKGAPQASHLDPLTATPKRNEFLETVVPFIESTRCASRVPRPVECEYRLLTRRR